MSSGLEEGMASARWRSWFLAILIAAGLIAAVRVVFSEIGGVAVPELVVINTADAADPMVIARLPQR